MFEVERTKKGYVIKHGTKGKPVEITEEQGQSLYDASVSILRIIDIWHVDEIYQALATLWKDPGIVKVRATTIKGEQYVTEVIRKPQQFDLPPEGDSEAE